MGETPQSPSIIPQEDGELSNDADFSDLFTVDSTPTETSDNIDTPLYEKKFSEVLQVKPLETPKPGRPKAPQNTCWNCEGSHSLRECTEPRNHQAINRNRLIFMSKQTSRPGKASRYHLDETMKYPHLRAGKISRRLRRALGLQSNQLPRHIYRMRLLGYPPGWVEEARVSHSGLSLFDSEGQEVADPGFEAGEVVDEGAKDKFDIKKIIEYPGFNHPYDADVIDEFERLNSKPMAEKDGIKFMKTMWQPKAVKAYKRRKMNSMDTCGTPNDKKQSLLLLEDMDLDSDVSDAASSAEEGEVDDGCNQNNDGESIADPTVPTTPVKAAKRSRSLSPKSPNSKRLKEEESQENSKSPTIESEPITNASPNTSGRESPKTGKVTSVSLGTPVIVTSPYTCLPSAEKFAKDICDVINFENLPDSTGKYKKMSGLIQKVRTFVSKLNSEEDGD